METREWPYSTTHLGTSIPNIAFGTWKLGSGQTTIDRVNQAFDVGFAHIGTSTHTHASVFAVLVLRLILLRHRASL